MINQRDFCHFMMRIFAAFSEIPQTTLNLANSESSFLDEIFYF